jgi:hypothetical protein
MMGSSPIGQSHVSVMMMMSRSLSVIQSEMVSALPSLRTDCALNKHSFRLFNLAVGLKSGKGCMGERIVAEVEMGAGVGG